MKRRSIPITVALLLGIAVIVSIILYRQGEPDWEGMSYDSTAWDKKMFVVSNLRPHNGELPAWVQPCWPGAKLVRRANWLRTKYSWYWQDPATGELSPAPSPQDIAAAKRLFSKSSGGDLTPSDPCCSLGEPVDIKLVDFLLLIHGTSGRTLVFETNRLSKVMFSSAKYNVDGLSWRQALDLVLSDHGFEIQVDAANSNVLHVVERAQL